MTNEAMNPQLVDEQYVFIDAQDSGMTAKDWSVQYQAQVMDLLTTHGAVVIRGLKVRGSKPFAKTLETLFAEPLLEYTYRSTPRTAMSGNVYTATEYPADQVIPLHNENAYANRWPRWIGFCCLVPPGSGGQTPICSSARVYRDIPQQIVTEFERKKLMYVRNYSDVDLPWSEVFQTEDKAQVEAYCRSNGLAFEWHGERLTTKQVTGSTLIHPVTKENLWFNQAHLFHISSLPEQLQQAMLASLDSESLPRNCLFGDGSEIPLEYLETIRTAYQKHKLSFHWAQGDLMLLDNLRFAHGREPFEGNRKVLTAMAGANTDAMSA